MAEENQVVETSQIEPQTTPVVEQPNPAEEQARALGWRPKEEFEGNPDEWRSAREFLERGQMIGKLRSNDRQIRQLEDSIKHIVGQTQRAYANGYDAAIKDLKDQKREALAEGDLVKAEEIADKIEDVKLEKDRAMQVAARPVQTRPDPEHESWLEVNPWYENRKMAAWADQAAKDFINERRGQVSPHEVRVYIHNLVRQDFPEKFAGSKKTTGAPSPDGESRSNNRGSTQTTQRFSKIESDMSETDRQIMKTVMRSANMTKEEYLKMYSENNR